MAMGLAVVVLLETTLRFLNWPPQTSATPTTVWAELPGASRLFEPNTDGSTMEIRPARRRFFAAATFPRTKPTHGFRIFCIGGSTVQGRPYGPETAFPQWLELALQAAQPERSWEVINAGGVSYASYRLAPIVEECLQYDADLIVVCCGHNEFLEERSFRTLSRVPSGALPVVQATTRLKLYQSLQHLTRRSPTAPRLTPLDPSDASASPQPSFDDLVTKLDFQNGLARFHRRPSTRRHVADSFRQHMTHIIDLTRHAGVPLILMLPPSNLEDCPPFKPDPGESLQSNPAALAEWLRLTREIPKALADDPFEAATLARRAVRLDPENPMSHFLLGRSLRATGRLAEAREAFVRARDLDVCPLRMPSDLESMLRSAANRHGVPLIDAHRLLERRIPSGILDSTYLVDHVHPSMHGHQLIALALVEQMAKSGWVRIQPHWAETRDDRFEAHVNELSPSYFPKGEQRLQALRRWTQGHGESAKELPSRQGIQ